MCISLIMFISLFLTNFKATVTELLELLTPQQALADMVQLTSNFKDELGCLQYDQSSKNYCPVISVGGSYPGFLSAMFRVSYPNFVDISYASSAPLKLYDQTADKNIYYDIVSKTFINHQLLTCEHFIYQYLSYVFLMDMKVTEAAEHASEGCADAVRSALYEAKELIKQSSSVKEAVESMNMCVDTVPSYITKLKTLSELSHNYCFHAVALLDTPRMNVCFTVKLLTQYCFLSLGADVIMAVGFSFANFDMVSSQYADTTCFDQCIMCLTLHLLSLGCISTRTRLSSLQGMSSFSGW